MERLYYPNGVLKYEGEIKNGKCDGKGKKYYRDGTTLKYEGDFKDDKFHGKGKLYYPDGVTLLYEGDYEDDFREGKGKLYRKDGTLLYEGDFKDDAFHGKGKHYYLDGITLAYEGDFLNNAFNGKGKKYYADGIKLEYEGDFKDDKFHGKGKLYYPDGVTLFYEGDFKDEAFNGKGKLYNRDGTVKYEGSFENDEIVYDDEDDEAEEGADPETTCYFAIGLFDKDIEKHLRNPKNFILQLQNGNNECESLTNLRKLYMNTETGNYDTFYECSENLMEQVKITKQTPLTFGPNDFNAAIEYVKVGSTGFFIEKPDWIFEGTPPEPRIFKLEKIDKKFLVEKRIAVGKVDPETGRRYAVNVVSGVHCDLLDEFDIHRLVPVIASARSASARSASARSASARSASASAIGGKKNKKYTKKRKIIRKNKTLNKKNKKYTKKRKIMKKKKTLNMKKRTTKKN